MADINQVITLGIGTPGDIEHFILVGLNILPYRSTNPNTIDIREEDRTIKMRSEDRTVEVREPI